MSGEIIIKIPIVDEQQPMIAGIVRQTVANQLRKPVKLTYQRSHQLLDDNDDIIVTSIEAAEDDIMLQCVVESKFFFAYCR